MLISNCDGYSRPFFKSTPLYAEKMQDTLHSPQRSQPTNATTVCVRSKRQRCFARGRKPVAFRPDDAQEFRTCRLNSTGAPRAGFPNPVNRIEMEFVYSYPTVLSWVQRRKFLDQNLKSIWTRIKLLNLVKIFWPKKFIVFRGIFSTTFRNFRWILARPSFEVPYWTLGKI